jgi:hypothetical protein
VRLVHLRVPTAGAPWRVAFVGQSAYFDACSLGGPASDLEPRFVEHRGGADPRPLVRELQAFAPHVVVVFRPETVAPGLFDDLPALTLGFNSEPLPRGPAHLAHPDLRFRLSELATTDRRQFDRIVTFDPLSAAAAEDHVDVWRSLPLPVDDRFYAPVREVPARPRVAFIGYSTEHRERFLVDVKHHFDVLHVAAGLHGAALRDLFARIDVAINLHGEPYPTFENRVCLHLAAGHLVISEPLSPTHGLEPGIDYLEVQTPGQLVARVQAIRGMPGIGRSVRVRGRLKAEQFRASRMWPRVIGDLVRDVRAFGTARQLSPGARRARS